MTVTAGLCSKGTGCLRRPAVDFGKSDQINLVILFFDISYMLGALDLLNYDSLEPLGSLYIIFLRAQPCTIKIVDVHCGKDIIKILL